MLLLFDIDGTLVRCGGAGRRALDRAFAAELGVERALDGVRLDGSTDPAIVEDAFLARLGRPPAEAEAERVLERYLVFLAEELAQASLQYEVLQGVAALLEAISRTERFSVGLATGNLERGARIKLGPGGLNTYFSFGGYGSDARERPTLVRRGIERGQADAARRFGRAFPLDQVLVLGDTELDVRAAREAGAVAVGVLCGSLKAEALRESGPELLVESLEDPALWSALGLSSKRGRA